MAIIQQNTANLARLANVLDLSAKRESKYRRLNRFLSDATPDGAIFAKLMIAILKLSGKYVLALRRHRMEIRQSVGQHFNALSRGREHCDPALLANPESQRQFDIGGKEGDD